MGFQVLGHWVVFQLLCDVLVGQMEVVWKNHHVGEILLHPDDHLHEHCLQVVEVKVLDLQGVGVFQKEQQMLGPLGL